MAQFSQAIKPYKMNLDASRSYLKDGEAWFILNQERLVNINGNASGSTAGEETPVPSNFPICDIDMPGGENYRGGSYYSEITNETYVFVYNSNQSHFIYRINGDGTCQIVYHGYLELSAEPRHIIDKWRCYLKVDKNSCNSHGKELIWTNGKHDIGCLDVEASIATEYFSTPYFDNCSDPRDFIRLCVPKPCGCIRGEWLPTPESERGLSNYMLNNGFKFMYKHIYYDGRESEWSDRSTLYYQDAKGCFENLTGFSRCLRLSIPLGNAMVDRIAIAYSTGGNNWELTETVEKYKKYNNSAEKWYERALSEELSISEDGCYFYYNFCNNKQCQPISPQEVDRVYNPLPREAQGFILIKGALGFYNYIKGNCPIDKKEAQNLLIEPYCTDSTDCTPEYATVTVRAVIHNTRHNRNQFIWKMSAGQDDGSDTARFGGLNPQFDGGFEVGYDQSFDGKVRNFTVYADGYDGYWQEMKQWEANRGWKNNINIGIVSNMNDGDTKRRLRRAARNGNFFYEEAKIRVRKGDKGFLRLASHHAQGNEQNTSTFVIGVIDDIRDYKGDALSSYNSKTEEIWFDTTNGDQELFQAFLIQDNAVDNGSALKAASYHGYLRDRDGVPIEGAIIRLADGLSPIVDTFQSTTDHNGFFHSLAIPEAGVFSDNSGLADAINSNATVDFIVLAEQDCGDFKQISSFTANLQTGFNTEINHTIDKDNAYNDNFYGTLNVRVNDCAGASLAGIKVSVSGSKPSITGANGVASIRVRNYSDRNRVLRSVVIDNRGCFGVDCSGKCNAPVPHNQVDAPACFLSGDNNKPVIVAPVMVINKDGASSGVRGLKNGGRYGYGFVVEWPCGKISSVNEVRYIDIPKAQTTGKIKYCGFKYKGGDMRLPEGASCLKIVRTENLNPFELQWVVDEFQRTPDGKIKLTIQSLNDYNSEYFFKTNTVYGYMDGDRVEFIRNGDGKVFSNVLNYLTVSPFHDKEVSGQEDAPADFFNQLLIEDDGKLSDLKKGAVIEIQRPKSCNIEPTYQEICATIPVEDGKLVYPDGVFYTFDTYAVSRVIGANPVQVFEHHSPSDFWGTKLNDTGKAHFVSKYENERRFGRNITLSNVSQINVFGYTEKTFDAPEHGDITAMNIVDGKAILAIGEHDNFLAQTADDLARIGSDGILRALPPDAVISDAQPKIAGSYGCKYDDTGSIFFGDGYAMWVDTASRSYIRHDYSMAKPVDEGVMESYFRKKCGEVLSVNSLTSDPLNKMRFMSGYNKHTKTVMLTIKSLRQSGVNNERDIYKKPNSTLTYHPASGDFASFVSFTPDGYADLDISESHGAAFVSFFNGLPYCHPVISVQGSYNEFYGLSCDWIVGIALNAELKKRKRAIAMEYISSGMFFAAEIRTDSPDFISEIPPVNFEKTGLNKWNAAFLGNKNSREGLFNGSLPEGYTITLLMVRDNTLNLAYNTVDNNKRRLYGELDMFFIKYAHCEQSGFTENL